MHKYMPFIAFTVGLSILSCGEETTGTSSSSSSTNLSSNLPLSSGTFSSSSVISQSKCKSLAANQFCDERDGQAYAFVKIGTQTWMAQNLNYGKMVPSVANQNGTTWGLSQNGTTWGEKFCYNDDSLMCKKYGGLYEYYEVLQLPFPCSGPRDLDQSKPKCIAPKPVQKGACPSGWHVPTDEEWKTLERFVGVEPAAIDSFDYRGIIAEKLKDTSFGGTDHFGMHILGSGRIESQTGESVWLNQEAHFWTASYKNYWIYRSFSNVDPYKLTIEREEMGDGSHSLSVRCIRD